MGTDRRPVVVLVVAAVLGVAVIGAALAPAWQFRPRSWVYPSGERPPVIPAVTRSARPTSPPRPQGHADHSTLLTMLLVVALVLAASALLAVAWWLWRRYQDSGVRRDAARPAGTVVSVPDAPEVPVLRRGVSAAQRLLDEVADPTNAIVAAWLALEEAAASAGVRRTPAQTPTEFTVSVLAATAADPGATAELLALYHRARFSAAGVSRGDVVAASRCLGVLAASWDALTPEAVDAAVRTAAGGANRGA